MALKAIIDKLEDVPEALRGEYTQVGEKFELGLEGVNDHSALRTLRTENGARRIEVKKVNDLYSPWKGVIEGRKPEDVLAVFDRLPELEAAAAGKIDEKKLGEMVETRLAAKVGPIQRQYDLLKTANTEKDTVIAGYQQKERTRAIHDGVRSAIGGAKGFQASAAEDALMLAERLFEVTEDGRVVTRDGVGVTPGIEPAAWLADMQNKRPHWWGPSVGGGAGGSGGGGGQLNGGANPYSAEGWNQTEQVQLYKTNPAKADQLAKLAGHRGATTAFTRPTAKK